MKDYLIDTHAHLDLLELSYEETMAKLQEYNVKKVIIPSVEVATLDNVLSYAHKSENFYAMIGIFPTEAKTYNEQVESKMIEMAKDSKIKAVGEIGLDYYWDKSFVDLQKEIFVRQIKMANLLNLPIVIHDRDAHKDTFDILVENNKSSDVLFHCFSGSVEFMQDCVAQGWYIALGGVVTFKNAIKPKEVASVVPLDRLVLETDSPYLTPVPFRGKTNHPAYVKYVAEEISKIRDISVEEIIDVTTTNAERLFQI